MRGGCVDSVNHIWQDLNVEDTLAVVGISENAERMQKSLNKNDVVKLVGAKFRVADVEFVNSLSLSRDRRSVLVNSVECVVEWTDQTRLIHIYRDPSSIPVRYAMCELF